jgi:hypothetical protein
MLSFFQCFVFLPRFYTYMTTRRQRLQSSYAINNEQDSPYISSQRENETYICSVGTLTRSSRLATSLDPGPSNAQLSHFYQGESSRSQPSLYSQNRQDHDCLLQTINLAHYNHQLY